MEKNKVTKRDYFNALRAMVEQVETVGDYTADDVLAFIDNEVEKLDAKAEKARAKAAEKKADGDALREKVFSVVTEVSQTAQEITDAIGDAEVSKSKVVARLTQLVNAGVVVKDEVKLEGGAKRMVYRLA